MNESQNSTGRMRIGELGRRRDVSADVLRAWERRYGLLSPTRTPGGFRLYSAADERRVARMQERIASGYSPAAAARAVLDEEAGPIAVDDLGGERAELAAALERFDESGAQTIIDRLLVRLGLATVLNEIVLPQVRELGRRWECGDSTIAHEHFATTILRARLLALARGWDAGAGPRALLACPPGEQHDIGLICFGLALRDLGWRITYLGQDTPVEATLDAAERLSPRVVVVAGADADRFAAATAALALLASRAQLAIAGAGAHADLARAMGARLVQDAPVAAAARIATLPAEREPAGR